MNNDSIDIYFTLKREVLNNIEGNKRNYLLNYKKEITYFFLIWIINILIKKRIPNQNPQYNFYPLKSYLSYWLNKFKITKLFYLG